MQIQDRRKELGFVYGVWNTLNAHAGFAAYQANTLIVRIYKFLSFLKNVY